MGFRLETPCDHGLFDVFWRHYGSKRKYPIRNERLWRLPVLFRKKCHFRGDRIDRYARR